MRPCPLSQLCIVVPVHSTQAKYHYIQGKGSYLQDYTQVRHWNSDKKLNHTNQLDIENKNTLWRDSLAKENTNIGIYFGLLVTVQPAPPAWRKVTGNLVWYLKIYFRRKARWVLDGHENPNPIGYMYAGIISRYSVQIAFAYADLNGLNFCAANIINTRLQAPSSQKDYIICGPDFEI